MWKLTFHFTEFFNFKKVNKGGLTEGERFGNMNKLSGRAARKQEAGRKKAKKALDKEEKVC